MATPRAFPFCQTQNHVILLDGQTCNTLYTRWTLAAMRKDALQRGLPAPDEACTRHHCLREGVEAPDLATVKVFFHYYISLSYGKIVGNLNGFSLASPVSRAQK
jgi:hypothetical protein